jgi:hypothetical protein
MIASPAPVGYRHPAYAESLREYGVPRRLPLCQGFILEREISGTNHRDAMGCYPLFSCEDWSRLPADLDAIGDGLVTLSLVPDPLSHFRVEDLDKTFDIVRHVKEHFIVGFGNRRLESIVSAQHRRKALRALRLVEIDRCETPAEYLDEWCDLYAVLAARHRLVGLSRFSRAVFAAQLRVPGIVAFRAIHRERLVGMTLWFVDGSAAYYHLGAYAAEGYQIDASFAMFWFALDALARSGVETVFLGGGAGASGQTAGLVRFKRGWATGACAAYFCAKILAPDVYAALASSASSGSRTYFPAYRADEFR